MGENTVALGIDNFENKTSKGNWVVDFWAEWCGPCKILGPTFDAVAGEMKGKVHFGKVDVDAEGELAQQFDVMSIPTLLFIKDGEIVDRAVGALSSGALKQKASELL